MVIYLYGAQGKSSHFLIARSLITREIIFSKDGQCITNTRELPSGKKVNISFNISTTTYDSIRT